MENSSITAADERLAKAEMEFPKMTKKQKAKSEKRLIKLGIYDPDWWNNDDLEHMDKIQEALQGNDGIKLNGAIVSRPELISLLTVQLGNPDVTHEDRQKLATLLENDGKTTQFRRPRFYTYDDKPAFNLVSGIMQAREDIWQKNSIIGLQKEVHQLTEQVTTSQKEVHQLTEQVKTSQKEMHHLTEQVKTSQKEMHQLTEQVKTSNTLTSELYELLSKFNIGGESTRERQFGRTLIDRISGRQTHLS